MGVKERSAKLKTRRNKCEMKETEIPKTDEREEGGERERETERKLKRIHRVKRKICKRTPPSAIYKIEWDLRHFFLFTFLLFTLCNAFFTLILCLSLTPLPYFFIHTREFHVHSYSVVFYVHAQAFSYLHRFVMLLLLFRFVWCIFSPLLFLNVVVVIVIIFKSPRHPKYIFACYFFLIFVVVFVFLFLQIFTQWKIFV